MAGAAPWKRVDQHLGDLRGEQLRLVSTELAGGGPGTRDGRGNASGVEQRARRFSG